MLEFIAVILILILTLGLIVAQLQMAMEIRTLKDKHVDLERGATLINPIYPDRMIPITSFPPQESYRKDPPKPQLPMSSPPPQFSGIGTGPVVGNPIFS